MSLQNYTVTVLDTAGIQNYIFNSNDLRENIGGSELARQATSDWVGEALDATIPNQHHNYHPHRNPQQPYDANFFIDKAADDQTGAAEVIYSGGGKTAILFGGSNHEQLAKDFVYALSKKILLNATGLALYAGHDSYLWGDKSKSLPETISAALRNLTELRGKLPPPLPTLGLSVTAVCGSTGLPANVVQWEDNQERPTFRSQQVAQKRAISEVEGKKRLRDLFSFVEGSGLQWTDDLDLIGRVSEEGDSYIAVVHADGNGMGQRIANLAKMYQQEHPQEPRRYITALRTLSEQLNSTARIALQNTINALVAHLQTEAGRDQYVTKNGKRYLPFRPIVFGGDDVTFVCAGNWGLALAHRYLHELEQQSFNDAAPYACAGVAIVKTHYPFARAYELSEELAKSAKKRVLAVDASKNASAIDWHISSSGLSGALKEIRQREYMGADGPLWSRPLLLDGGRFPSWRTWPDFVDLLEQFQKDWKDQKNKTAALRIALRQGQTAVRQFTTIYQQITLPKLTATRAKFKDGWVEEDGETRCAYFDAIETVDQFWALP